MFSKDYEFRYGDLDSERGIKLSTVMDLLQDAAIDHASVSGLDSDFLQTKSIAFLLDGWRIKFLKHLNPKMKATVKTGIVRVRKCETLRIFEILQDGERVASVTSMWFAVNMEKRSIARLTEDFYSGFECITEEDNGLEYTNLRPLKETEYCGSYKVAKRDTDSNKHMNNVKSVEFMLDYLPDGFNLSELQVKYRKELLPDEDIKVYSKETDNGFYIEIRNSEDKPCVLLNAIE